MSNFQRISSSSWQNKVPGSRWFRSDLHLHTLDDHPNTNLKRPSAVGADGLPEEPNTQTAYARAFLQAAIANNIQVLGLTPHAVKSGDTDTTSATWRIVEVWNEEDDDDGVPFRDKIYAVFPGFEPSFNDGAEGIHLIFLFDPEIGRSDYLAAFTQVMAINTAYSGHSLQMSSHPMEKAISNIEIFHERQKHHWDYLCLAPHAFGRKGLFKLKGQVLEHFPRHKEIRGLELKDDHLPEDAYTGKNWLEGSMKELHYTFYHASDAYRVTDIGKRFTMIKLAIPKIEALRQAFLSSDSRTQIAYQKDMSGALVVRGDLQKPLAEDRPWLRKVTVSGGTSFFKEQTFNLNPDFNCIIGGRMSGKSVLLDGLRVWFDHNLPVPDKFKTREVVESRAKNRFLSGSPEISVDICSPELLDLPDNKKWPAQFYTQRELQSAATNQATMRDVIHRLIPGYANDLTRYEKIIKELDDKIDQGIVVIRSSSSEIGKLAEEYKSAKDAKKALKRFEEAGIGIVKIAQEDKNIIQIFENQIDDKIQNIENLELDTEGLKKIQSEELKNILGGKLKIPEETEEQDVLKFTEFYNTHLIQAKAILEKIQSINSKASLESITSLQKLYPFTPLFEEKKFIGCVFSKVH
jgi:hypothetical protein